LQTIQKRKPSININSKKDVPNMDTSDNYRYEAEIPETLSEKEIKINRLQRIFLLVKGLVEVGKLTAGCEDLAISKAVSGVNERLNYVCDKAGNAEMLYITLLEISLLKLTEDVKAYIELSAKNIILRLASDASQLLSLVHTKLSEIEEAIGKGELENSEELESMKEEATLALRWLENETKNAIESANINFANAKLAIENLHKEILREKSDLPIEDFQILIDLETSKMMTMWKEIKDAPDAMNEKTEDRVLQLKILSHGSNSDRDFASESPASEEVSAPKKKRIIKCILIFFVALAILLLPTILTFALLKPDIKTNPFSSLP